MEAKQMKATLVQLKAKVKRLTQNTGYDLSSTNPYYANAEHIKLMEGAIEMIVWNGNESPEKHYTATPAQQVSLDTWIASLKDRYLTNL